MGTCSVSVRSDLCLQGLKLFEAAQTIFFELMKGDEPLFAIVSFISIKMLCIKCGKGSSSGFKSLGGGSAV